MDRPIVMLLQRGDYMIHDKYTALEFVMRPHGAAVLYVPNRFRQARLWAFVGWPKP